jgi:protein subunit release factor B
MLEVGLREEDIEERFIRGSGSGGQKVNKTSSCVTLKHIPTGIEVRCQRERTQSLNRFFARRELCDKLEARKKGFVERQRAEVSKIRRQKAKRSRRTKEKILRGKAHRSSIKKLRGSANSE